jgi:CDP-diacylglycerol--glycerol-3-phosphate 3-phosphatidyltransferase
MAELVFLSDKNRERYLRLVGPVGTLLARVGVHPNIISLCGLILSAFAGLLYSTGAFFWGGWVVVLAGTCDILDGMLARRTGKGSRFGAFFDSTLDRFGEIFIFAGLAWCFAGGRAFFQPKGADISSLQSPTAVVLIMMAIAGSFLVSYTRARAEGLGVKCTVGWMQRPERIVLLVIGSLLGSLPAVGPLLMKLTLLVLAIFSNFTALQRMFHVRNQLLKDNETS